MEVNKMGGSPEPQVTNVSTLNPQQAQAFQQIMSMVMPAVSQIGPTLGSPYGGPTESSYAPLGEMGGGKGGAGGGVGRPDRERPVRPGMDRGRGGPREEWGKEMEALTKRPPRSPDDRLLDELVGTAPKPIMPGPEQLPVDPMTQILAGQPIANQFTQAQTGNFPKRRPIMGGGR
jgi:hypothetical protein